MDEAHDRGLGFLAVPGDAPEPFEPLEGILDLVPRGMEAGIERVLDCV